MRLTQLLLGGVAAVALTGAQAHAATAQDERDQDPAALAEVVVTAERVESTLQRTPLSLAVVGNDQLVDRGVNTLAQLQNVEPTVIFNQGGINTTSIAIRGVSSVGGQGFGGGAVTIDHDGQYMLAYFNAPLYDVNRVEVLKGPQGTLYGLNATAGTINIITNAPDPGGFAARGSVEVGNYDAVLAEGMLNAPLGDTAAVRLAVQRNRRSGFREHPGLDATDLVDVTAGRLSFLWKPTSALSARLTAEYIDQENGSTALQGVIIPASAETPAGLPPTAFRPNLNPRSWPLNFQGYSFGFQRLIRGQIDYDFGWAHLTYLGGYRYTKLKMFHPNFGTPVQVVDYQQTNWAETHQEELRLAGTTGFGTRWQVGAFFLRYAPSDFTNVFNTVTRFHEPRTLPFIHFDDLGMLSRNRALYGQLTQSLTDKVSITGGLRYTWVKQAVTNRFNYALSVPAYVNSSGAVIQRGVVDARGRNNYERTSWRVGLDYQATSSNLIYASASTSFKDGGFTQINVFLPEDIEAYELGSKNRFLNGRLQFNAAIYHYKYQNQQATAFVVVTPATPTTPALSQGTTVNAGRSRLNGAEANLIWQATARDQLSLAAAYTDAKYTQFIAAQPVIPLGTVTAVTADLSGNIPPNAPKWLITAGYGHTFALGRSELELRADARYSSAYHLSIFNLPGDRQKGYVQTDLTANFHPPGGRWEASAYVRNLEDNDVLNYGQFVVQGQGIFTYGWAPPRTYGVRVSAQF